MVHSKDNKINMSPSKKCKEAGLSSLAELSAISTVSVDTLRNWFKYKPVVFNVILTGARKIKVEKEFEIFLNHWTRE